MLPPQVQDVTRCDIEGASGHGSAWRAVEASKRMQKKLSVGGWGRGEGAQVSGYPGPGQPAAEVQIAQRHGDREPAEQCGLARGRVRELEAG